MAVFFFGILAIVFLFCAAVAARHDVHIFQLNGYKPGTHLHWLRRAFAGDWLPGHIFAVLAVPAALLPFPAAVGLGILLLGLQAWKNLPKKAKKPLVFTPRVKRLLAAMAVILLLVVALAGRFMPHAPLLFALAVVLSPCVMLAANALNSPIERRINRRYTDDARRILAAHPGLTVIGITGSYGKTSVKHFLHRLLSAKYTVLMTPGNFNTTLGVVRTVREELRPVHEIFLCEMGARNVGDIKEICDLAKPKHGVVTAVGPQHLESFKTLDNVVKTKFELADALPEDGLAFLNYDSADIRRRETACRRVGYCLEPGGADYVARDIAASRHGSSFRLRLADGQDVLFETRLIGRHNVLNVAAAIAVADRLGVPAEDLAVAVRRLDSVPHRLQLVDRGELTIIDDAYNANAAGARAALEALALFDGMRILVTPGMVELGAMEDRLNREFGQRAAGVCDRVLLVGERRTRSIREGLADGGMAEGSIAVVGTVEEAFGRVHGFDAGGRRKYVLVENDLPDNF